MAKKALALATAAYVALNSFPYKAKAAENMKYRDTAPYAEHYDFKEIKEQLNKVTAEAYRVIKGAEELFYSPKIYGKPAAEVCLATSISDYKNKQKQYKVLQICDTLYKNNLTAITHTLLDVYKTRDKVVEKIKEIDKEIKYVGEEIDSMKNKNLKSDRHLSYRLQMLNEERKILELEERSLYNLERVLENLSNELEHFRNKLEKQDKMVVNKEKEIKKGSK